MSRAHPSDQFVMDLRIDDLDSLASVEIVMKVEEEFGITVTDDEAQSISTIEQLVNLVACQAGPEAMSARPRARNVSLRCELRWLE